MKKILFIEDEPALQRAIGKILADGGYVTLPALDGETGVQLAMKEIPDLILLDLILPKKDGFEVIKELKSSVETAHIPIIILSNLEAGHDVERAVALGATTYLIKTNYTLEEVLEKVRSMLDK